MTANPSEKNSFQGGQNVFLEPFSETGMDVALVVSALK